uniref:ShKT domain-containing protein n=1 Tax=Entomoneis paludosa TaxID=265537 RepID=A0A7S3DY85_9STRA|mmetsp:Transcript_9467/g.19681  ORF Transcript_9467/g.19681 Transcript_9467/m.19681 type:complete len:239 (+) Transcript_9467:146-862(+)
MSDQCRRASLAILWLLMMATNSCAQEVDVMNHLHGPKDPSSSSTMNNDDDTQCILGACFLERNLAQDYKISRSELICHDLRDDCQDRNQECATNKLIWASCPKSCQACEGRIRRIPAIPANQNLLLREIPWGNHNENTILEGVGSDFGILQLISQFDATWEYRDKMMERALRVKEYYQYKIQESGTMSSLEDGGDATRELMEHCQNRNSMCIYWAVTGECEVNRQFMRENCAPSCFRC